VGHFTQNCPTKEKQRISLIDFNPEEEDTYEGQPPMEESRVAQLYTELGSMNFKEKQQLMHQIKGNSPDFLSV